MARLTRHGAPTFEHHGVMTQWNAPHRGALLSSPCAPRRKGPLSDWGSKTSRLSGPASLGIRATEGSGSRVTRVTHDSRLWFGVAQATQSRHGSSHIGSDVTRVTSAHSRKPNTWRGVIGVRCFVGRSIATTQRPLPFPYRVLYSFQL